MDNSTVWFVVLDYMQGSEELNISALFLKCALFPFYKLTNSPMEVTNRTLKSLLSSPLKHDWQVRQLVTRFLIKRSCPPFKIIHALGSLVTSKHFHCSLRFNVLADEHGVSCTRTFENHDLTVALWTAYIDPTTTEWMGVDTTPGRDERVTMWFFRKFVQRPWMLRLHGLYDKAVEQLQVALRNHLALSAYMFLRVVQTVHLSSCRFVALDVGRIKEYCKDIDIRLVDILSQEQKVKWFALIN